MSSWSSFVSQSFPAADEAVLVREPESLGDTDYAALPTPELRTGTWTRLGDRSLLGDPITESLLGAVADRARIAAESEGYTVGWAKGKADAEAEIMRGAAERIQQMEAAFDTEEQLRLQEHSSAIETLAQAAEGVRGELSALAERIETQATELAWTIVETLLGRELITAGGPDVIRRVLQVMPQSPLVTVRLHPDVVASADLTALYDRGAEVVPDTTLAQYDALVSADGAVIDLRISTAVERLRGVLR